MVIRQLYIKKIISVIQSGLSYSENDNNIYVQGRKKKTFLTKFDQNTVQRCQKKFKFIYIVAL